MAKLSPSESLSASPKAPDTTSSSPTERKLSVPIAFGKTVLDSSLPIPDPVTLTIRSDPTKKSHARKQPPGHIPRPRNAFILFRCDFVRQHKVPQEIEGKHSNISRIAGAIWQHMTAEQRKPWKDMAEEEKRKHKEKHPGYKYRPVAVGVRARPKSRGRPKISPKRRRAEELGSSTDYLQSIKQSPSPVATPDHTPIHTPPTHRALPLELPMLRPNVPSNYFPEPLRRSSSCPPSGAFPVTQPMNEYYNTLPGHPKTVRDDLSRRPSRVTFYQSSPTSGSFPVAPPIPTNFPFPFHENAAVQYAPLDAVAPPGWYKAPPQSAHWTQWTGDVGKQFERQAAMRNHDFDNSFGNTIPHWIGTSIPDPGPSFTNPFDGGNGTPHPFSHTTRCPSQPISPLDTSFMTLRSRPEFPGNSWIAGSAGSPQVQLDDYRLPSPGPYHTQAISVKANGVPHDTYQACFIPDRSQGYASGPSDGIDVTEELRKLVPRISLYEKDTSDPDTSQQAFNFMPRQKTGLSDLQGGWYAHFNSNAPSPAIVVESDNI
ncbi:HMG(highmobilitygroup)box domain-containing protein [Moniliophthora roreri MCA 2997]|uniref:HMG(Highmobilitygroup)box domain-containing protein n=2 Tax=Moniliophthora roreri TaxID=221103 RepID=V2WQ82_MONRO|nr:HMG(highmobilitygroup)box domain-containing protein [Moniliophthora roreri MCA 2997]KAI3597582.1 HMG(highmobilitygroup)box domain-containing protein [Moniliophthora roreri]